MASKVFDLSVIFSAIDRISKPMLEASKKLDRFQKNAQNISRNLKTAGDSMTRNLTMPILGIGAISSKIAISFDDSMRQVKAITNSTDADFKKLTATALGLGKTTRFTASQAAQGMKFLGMAGFNTTKIIAAMPNMLDLAAASSLDLARAADITSDVMTMFKIGAGESGKAVDVLAKVTNRSNVSMEQLFEALKFIGPTLAPMGAGVEELAAAIGILGDGSLKGGIATRALSTAFTSLAKPNKAAVEQMAALGIKAFDAKENFVGFTSVLEQTDNATKNLTEKQRAMVIATIFGKEAVRSINILLTANKDIQTETGEVTLNGIEALKGYTKELKNSEGTAKKMAKTMEGGIGGSVRRVISALEGMAITLGNILAPMIDRIGKKIRKFTAWFDKLTPATQKWIVKIALLVAAIGPLLLIFSKVVAIISMVSKAWVFLLANPIVLKIALIVAIVAALTFGIIKLVKTIKKWEQKTKGVTRVFGKIKKILKKLKPLILAIAAPFALLFAPFIPLVAVLVTIIKKYDLLNKAMKAFKDVVAFLQKIDWEKMFFGFFDAIEKAIDSFDGFLDRMEKSIKEMIDKLKVFWGSDIVFKKGGLGLRERKQKKKTKDKDDNKNETKKTKDKDDDKTKKSKDQTDDKNETKKSKDQTDDIIDKFIAFWGKDIVFTKGGLGLRERKQKTEITVILEAEKGTSARVKEIKKKNKSTSVKVKSGLSVGKTMQGVAP